MKKYVLDLLIIAMIISLFACSNKNTNNNDTESSISPSELIVGTGSPSPTADSSLENEDTDENEKITLEDVMSHPVTPESYFSVRETEDGCCEIAGYSGSDSIVVIPETVEGMKVIGIRHKVFRYDSNIVGVRLSDTIEYIDYEAFIMAKELKYVVSGKNLKKISEQAFFNCSKLSEVKLNDGLEKLGSVAFALCKNLKSIYIPQSVNEILSFDLMYEDFTIYGMTGSKAEEFANEYNFKFVPVSGS